MAGADPRISLVLACYNEGPRFPEHVEQILAALTRFGRPFEVVFVDDHSADETPRWIERAVEAHPDAALRVVRHERNIGRGASVADGIRRARGELVGFLDADLEIPLDHLPEFVSAVDDGADLAVGDRAFECGWRSAHRVAASRLFRWLVARLLDIPPFDTQAGFKFFRRACALDLIERARDGEWFWDTEVVYWALRRGWRVRPVRCVYRRDFAKKSTVRFVPDALGQLGRLVRLAAGIRRGEGI